ncbi:hypothetical protein R6Q57_002514 [Mikania cordata]
MEDPDQATTSISMEPKFPLKTTADEHMSTLETTADEHKSPLETTTEKHMIQPIYVFSVADLLDLHRLCNWVGKRKEAFHSIILTAVWCIWKAKNDAVFNGKQRSYVGILKEVQSLIFFWGEKQGCLGIFNMR